MTPRERVMAALSHVQPDYTPCDYFGTPEIHQALLEHFAVGADPAKRVFTGGVCSSNLDNTVAEILGTDIRYVKPPYVGPPLPDPGDGSTVNVWGVRRRPVANQYGSYAEPVGAPYATWETVEEAERFRWPDPDWFDYDTVRVECARYPDHAVAIGGFDVPDFINGVAFGRGVERVLLDIAEENPVYLYIVEKRHSFFLCLVERMLQSARGRVDIVLCGDDFGTQRGPLISPAKFMRLFAPKKKEFCDMVHSYGAKVVHHSCGSTRALIPQFIACGVDALQTIQRRAARMDPFELKAEFGRRIALHGAVDVQGFLQEASPGDVETEVHRLMDGVGQGGGYVLGPSHNIQPDVPLENILALYRTVARRRGSRHLG